MTVADLPVLTAKVAQNNLYSAAPVATDAVVMGFLQGRIKHVICIVKENRTYDQVLGDLGNGGNGDPTLTQFGKRRYQSAPVRQRTGASDRQAHCG